MSNIITADEIQKWINIPSETEVIEFKEAKNGYDLDKLYRYCIGIANEGGGSLVFGMTNSPPRKVIGTKAFPDLRAIAERVFDNVQFRVDFYEAQHDGNRLVAARIPSRPRGTAYAHKGAYLMRSGERLVPMSEDQLRKIFSEQSPDWLKEPGAKGIKLKELSEILNRKAFFDLLGKPDTGGATAFLEELQKLRLVAEVEGEIQIRNIGLLMLAQDLSGFPDIQRKSPRVIVYSGTNKLDTVSDHTGHLGYAVGFSKLMKYIMEKMPRNEVLKDSIRREVELFPERPMRELVANALIHQDFEESGSRPTVEIYSNRLEISNPGKPVVPAARFIDQSKSRNETLAFAMRRLGICEERSSGIDHVISTAELYQLPAPQFIEDISSTLVIIHGPRKLEDMAKEDRIRACYQHCVLKYVFREHMTNDSLRERFGLDAKQNTTASRIIRATAAAGLISVDPAVGDSRKFARYMPFWAAV